MEGSLSDSARLSLRRVVGFGGCVCGGKPSTNENHECSNGRCANGSRFGVGGLVPAAGCGVRRVCPCARSRSTDFVTDSRTETDERRANGSPLRTGRGCPCDGFWVSAGVSVDSINARIPSAWTLARQVTFLGGFASRAAYYAVSHFWA